VKKRNLLNRIKVILYFVLFYSGALHLLLLMYKTLKKKHHAVILCYHRIVDKNSDGYLHKNHSVHHSAKDFHDEISFLSKWFRIISLDDLYGHIKDNFSHTEPTVVITFDDGYKDNYDNAYPLLRRYDLPATIYLTAGLIGSEKGLWTDQVEFALLQTTKKEIVFPQLCGHNVIDISSKRNKLQANRLISKALKNLDNSKRMSLLAELFGMLKVTYESNMHLDRRMLTWEEVEEMRNNGITFGAHTMSHPILTHMSLDEAKMEIAQSKSIIEKKIGSRVKHFAIPNGTVNDFTEDLRKFCIDQGFNTIATMEYGYVANTSDPFFLRRVSAHVPIYCFAGELLKLFFFSSRYEKNAMVYSGASLI